MEISIFNVYGTAKPVVYKVLFFKMLSSHSDLFVLEEEEWKNSYGYGIFKVQFIALCSTEVLKNLIVAFYLSSPNNHPQLRSCVLSGLPDNLYQKGVCAIDYKSYCDICLLTGEKVMSLPEFINFSVDGSVIFNQIIMDRGSFINIDSYNDLPDDYELSIV